MDRAKDFVREFDQVAGEIRPKLVALHEASEKLRGHFSNDTVPGMSEVHLQEYVAIRNQMRASVDKTLSEFLAFCFSWPLASKLSMHEGIVITVKPAANVEDGK